MNCGLVIFKFYCLFCWFERGEKFSYIVNFIDRCYGIVIVIYMVNNFDLIFFLLFDLICRVVIEWFICGFVMVFELVELYDMVLFIFMCYFKVLEDCGFV